MLGDFDPADYRTERRWAKADDGTEVPISLVYRPDLVGPDPERVAPAPCLLYGYGSYEVSMDPTFSSLRLSLLDRGLVFAIAHVRGGGEMGRRWYEEGKLAAKPNTFTDFLACARSLIAEGWTAPDRLVARGGSAGGLLMGAVANLAPELFRAIVAEVPFVDCLTTIMDESLPLTVTEWEEWGNPVADAEIYRVMKSYSPYDNVRSVDDEGRPVRYPDILATAGLTDPRVGFWEPAKWVAKLRAANPGQPGPAEDRARRGPRRSLRPLRRLEGGGLRLRVRPRRARHRRSGPGSAAECGEVSRLRRLWESSRPATSRTEPAGRWR